MKQATVEFHRPVEALRIPPAGSTDKLAATPKECAAVAKRLMLPAIHSLSAVLDVSHWREGGLQVRGQVVSELDQVCVVTLEPFRSLARQPVDSIRARAELLDGTQQLILGEGLGEVFL